MNSQNQSKDLDSITQNPRWTVSARRTVNLGNYESLTLGAEYSADVPEGKKHSEFVQENFERVEKMLVVQFAKNGISVD